MIKGKVAIITGGSRGIGRACALKMASLGADIAIIYAGNDSAALSVCSELENFDVCAMPVKCDVSDFEAVKNAVAAVKERFRTVDILINSAGITRDGLSLKMKEEDFDSVIDVNLKGTFNFIRHCAPIFLRQKAGKIINISSVSGINGNAGQANYSASKAGVIGLTKSVAKELAPRGICCNAIAPGLISTDMTASFGEDSPIMSQIPMKRIGRPEEVAALAAFLASADADYITGEVIRIDGGMAM